MHCAACELVVEKKCTTVPGVRSADALLGEQVVVLSVDGSLNEDAYVAACNAALSGTEYSVHVNTSAVPNSQFSWNDTVKALVLALLVFGVFVVLQKIGLLSLIPESETLTLPTVFMVGVVASLSSCMALVGGLVLSLSSRFAQTQSAARARMHMTAFHAARLVGFVVLGGLLGLLGSALTLSATATFVIHVSVFLVMVILGGNLLGVPWLRRFQLRLPKRLGRAVVAHEGGSWLTPILVGAGTFFVPCGFTQAMQFAALSSADIVRGATIMGVFALGTLPALALISVASFEFAQSRFANLFFKTAGALVIIFACITLWGALAAQGYVRPLTIFS